MKIAITGAIEITMPAISCVYCDEYSPWNWSKPTGTVRDSLALTSTSAMMNSFQVARLSMMNSVASAGSDSGSMIRQKITSSDAPSMRAHSISSVGISRKKPRITKIWNGSPKAT